MRKFVIFAVVALVVVAMAAPAFATGNSDITVPLDSFGMTESSISLLPGDKVVSVVDGSGNVLGSQNVVVGSESVVLDIPILWNGEPFKFQGSISLTLVTGGLWHGEYMYPPENFVGSLFIADASVEEIPVTDGIFNIFGTIGTYLMTAVSSLVAIFWTGTSLTFIGVMSVCALALALILLLIGIIRRLF